MPREGTSNDAIPPFAWRRDHGKVSRSPIRNRLVQVTHLVSTSVLNLLAQRKLLTQRLRGLGFSHEDIRFLQMLRREGAVEVSPVAGRVALEKMIENRLATWRELPSNELIRCKRTLRRQGRELFLLQAVNFEITYRCAMSCSHCLQKNVRQADIVELETHRFVQAIRQTWFAALPLVGINLTGGEPLAPDSPVLELIREAQSLGMPVRLNTNSWWGDTTELHIGGETFATPEILVGHLREIGLGMLALSYDERVHQNPRTLNKLLGAMRACEQNQLPYQIIFTGITTDEMERILQLAAQSVPFPLKLCDSRLDAENRFGRRSRFSTVTFRSAWRWPAVRKSTRLSATNMVSAVAWGSAGRAYLHISPDGAIRSCLYAPRLGNLGNLAKEDLLDAVNRFPSDPVSTAFRRHDLPVHVERSFRPYARLYRPIVHPCSACALLARIIDEEHKFALREGHPPEGEDLEAIHLRVGREYNLLCGVERYDRPNRTYVPRSRR